MDPGFHGGVEELEPVELGLLGADVEHQRITQEQMLEAKTCGYSTKVKQVPAKKSICYLPNTLLKNLPLMACK